MSSLILLRYFTNDGGEDADLSWSETSYVIGINYHIVYDYRSLLFNTKNLLRECQSDKTSKYTSHLRRK
jgi:hypothetical protein